MPLPSCHLLWKATGSGRVPVASRHVAACHVVWRKAWALCMLLARQRQWAYGLLCAPVGFAIQTLTPSSNILIPLPERAQLWKSRPTDVRGLREWVCHRLSCSCLLPSRLCFLLPLSFTLFSWEREHFCPELKLLMIHFMGVWDDRSSSSLGEL